MLCVTGFYLEILSLGGDMGWCGVGAVIRVSIDL